jgi:methionine sulfoxide reductase heme-binding subunit
MKHKNMPRKRSWLLHPLAKPSIWLLCSLPFIFLFWRTYTDQLGPNPAEALIRGTGDWTLRGLCITLTITPLRHYTGLHALALFRRSLGLFTFFYGTLHFLSYAWFDMGLDWNDILKDIPKRPFALVGLLAFTLMIPLAATSFNRAIRWLGGTRWKALHRLVYASALLGLLHFFWMRAAKNNFNEVAIYALILALLLGWRLWHKWSASKNI